MTNDRAFQCTELALPGVYAITPRSHTDSRGSVALTYEPGEFASLGITASFVQDFSSYSAKDVIRGLHIQCPPHAQDKLVRCSSGRIFDVVADIDPASPTYGKHLAMELDAVERTMLYIPGRYAHGYAVIGEEGATVEYKMSDLYYPECSTGIRYDDPRLAIVWPVNEPVLSMQDRSWSHLL